jgi:phosphoribosylaminoimidazole-succinocarboxamide synthase
VANSLRLRTLGIYKYCAKYALDRGIIIADTKLEFGTLNGGLILIDEVLTPDSSRFWPADEYKVRRSQPSFDKQFVRDYLTESGWDKEPPAPELPAEIVEKTADKYRQAYRMLVGKEFGS